MLMHFLNNSVAVLAMHTTSHGGFIGKINDLLTIDFNNFNTVKFLGLIILSIILAFIGSKLLNNKEKQV